MTNEELTQKYVDLDERITRHTEQIKTAFNRIDDVKNLADSVHKLAISVEILTREQQSSNSKIDELATDVEEMGQCGLHSAHGHHNGRDYFYFGEDRHQLGGIFYEQQGL